MLRIDIDENMVADSFIFLDKRRVLKDYASQYVYLKRAAWPASLVQNWKTQRYLFWKADYRQS